MEKKKTKRDKQTERKKRGEAMCKLIIPDDLELL